jgi:hypothetical protein
VAAFLFRMAAAGAAAYRTLACGAEITPCLSEGGDDPDRRDAGGMARDRKGICLRAVEVLAHVWGAWQVRLSQDGWKHILDRLRRDVQPIKSRTLELRNIVDLHECNLVSG